MHYFIHYNRRQGGGRGQGGGAGAGHPGSPGRGGLRGRGDSGCHEHLRVQTPLVP